MLKLNSATPQYLSMAANASLRIPDGDSTTFFPVRLNTAAPGASIQCLYSTGDLTLAMNYGRLNLYSTGLAGNNYSAVLDFAPDYLVFFTKSGTAGNVYLIPVSATAPADDSSVVTAVTATLLAAFTGTTATGIGCKYDGNTARGSDHTIGTVTRVDRVLTKLEMAKLAYGMPLSALGYTAAVCVQMDKLANVKDTGPAANVVTVHGAPTDAAEPAYGYVAPPANEFGTIKKFFGPDSFWNSRPTGLTFGNPFEIPKDYNPSTPYNEWHPTVSSGPYSTKVCPVYEGDGPMTVYANSSKGFKDSDSMEYFQSKVFPRWNDGVIPATGSDGHCDIYDTVTDTVINFWGLCKDAAGRWTCSQVSYVKVTADTYGWGNGAQFSMGARSSGALSSAGLIRSSEVGDGKPVYDHVLTMSMAASGLSKTEPGYTAPACLADNTYYDNLPKLGTGIPLGALMMLPPGTDLKPGNAEELKFQNSHLEAMGGHGSYVTDRNTNTPMAWYVENGGPTPTISSAFLDRMRPALKQVTAVANWINGNGQPRVPENPNLMSLRPPYVKINSATGPIGVFNSGDQTIEFPEATTNSSVQQTGLARHMSMPERFAITPGKTYRWEGYGTGNGAKARLNVWTTTPATATAVAKANGQFSLTVAPGEHLDFVMVSGYWFTITLSKVAGPAGSIGATFKEV